MSPPDRGHTLATLLGIAAIVIWGSLIGVARSVIEQVGVLWSAAAVSLVGGGLGLVVTKVWVTRRPESVTLSVRYLFGCGLLFVVYNAAIYIAIRLAADRSQTVEIGLVNYLWPALTVALGVPILRHKAGPGLLPGLIIAMVGIYLGMTTGKEISLQTIGRNLLTGPWPYVLGLLAAISWALYSNIARRWAGNARDGAVPIFLLATGVVLAAAAAAFEPLPRHTWTVRAVAELLYLAVFPTLLAYVFWDTAMRRGNIILVSSVSFFTPLISTIMSCLYLRVPMGLQLWAACGLVIVGAAVCKQSVTETQEKPAATALE
jgi:drug/metabolite transporter (DMT)-like permease